ncbi:LysR family transcriptional regulator [Mumia sp. ZJ1417]|uniref:LysR family transcriptional regulator n=1 Tax=Mumia sp. ZJ1417 TaxID=2708082 RepID=UPI001421972C|nr:LysR family transcriptional regulator [Mumia sp. ZJ1417]QMW67493.1 LysR family transcriptional regulator [Mumia sp. ZJ1417]
MTPDVDVQTLRLLVGVAEHGSIGAAAREHDMTQPAASARLREFEARWRISVLDRSPGGSRLTEDGEAVVSWARTLLHELDTVRSSLLALGEERRSGVAVAASLTIAELILPRWLAELRARRPQVSPRLHVVNSDTVAAMVRGGEVDLGFVETTDVPGDLARQVVGHDSLAVVVAPAHPWARRRTPLTREELQAGAYVLREPGSGTRSTFERALRQEPHVVLEASSTSALLGAAAAGVGPAVVSRRAVAAEVEQGRLVVVPAALDMRRPLTAIWARRRRLSDAASDLVLIATEASRASG